MSNILRKNPRTRGKKSPPPTLRLTGHGAGSIPLRQVRFPGASRDFDSQNKFSVQTLLPRPHSSRVCINIYGHVKDPKN